MAPYTGNGEIRQAMYYNVILRCVRVSTDGMEKQHALHILSVSVALVTQHAKRSGVLCCRLWPVWLHNILQNYLINDAIFGKKLSGIKCVLRFSPRRFFLKHFSF